MGSDVKQSLAAAEKLLKAGNVAAAIAEFDRVVEESNGDLLTVNRVGDAIVSAGKPERAVPYYARIADQFSRQGFYPKAIAIRKKILRLTPESAEALVGLGDLYVQQEHPAEARSFYLRAADLLLKDKDFNGAREVYERLVRAEPDDPRHRVRLAETRAAAGDEAEAAGDLVELGQRLLESGKPEDAEKAFRRAGELAPASPGVVTGLIACFTETGRDDEALKLLEDEVGKPDAAIELVAELLVLYEVNGRTEDANGVLTGERAGELPLDTFRTLVRFHDRKGGQDELWSRLEPVLKGWLQEPLRDKLCAALDAWPTWTEKPHLAALEWRLELAAESGDEEVQVRLLEQLVETYGKNEQQAEADKALARLQELRPPVETVPEAQAPFAETVQPDAETADSAPEAQLPAVKDVPVEFEAPAVPLSRADEEFVSGRMTQAEILEKYGLLTQAMDQIYEVIERFPGHLEANQHLVTLLRGTSQESTLAQALVKLALARRAAGRLEVGREAAAEADKLGGIDPETRRILVALDLFTAATGAGVDPAPGPAPEPAAAATPEVTPPQTKPAPPAVPAAGEAVIDFDSLDDEEEDESDVQVAAEAAAEPVEVSPQSAPVESRPAVAKPAAPVAAKSKATESAMRFEPLPAVEDDQDDDDLRAIAAALDDDLFEDDPIGETPASESEESLEEVFAAFRERVEEEVGAEDFRTHYDLGIGYKEMGLIDAALAEFEISVKSDELFQVSCVMLAICFREQQQPEVAADWYRRALEALGGDASNSFELRYDLAQVLAETGETKSALDVYRDLQQLDPGFRDVADRISELAATVSE